MASLTNNPVMSSSSSSSSSPPSTFSSSNIDDFVEEYLPPPSVNILPVNNNSTKNKVVSSSTTISNSTISNNKTLVNENKNSSSGGASNRKTNNYNKSNDEFSLTINTSTSHGGEHVFTPIQRRGSRIPISSTWLLGIAVVNFDVKIGQKVSTLIPEDVCDEEIKKRIALLSLPDSYSGNDGDMLYSFRVRTNKLKYTQSIDRTFLYGHAYFARQKDATAARGFHQSAVVYLTELPYAALFRTLADVTGPLFFELGKGVLKTIVSDIAKWPEPKPGVKMTLPVSGMVLSFRVPVLLVGELDNIMTTTTNNNKESM